VLGSPRTRCIHSPHCTYRSIFIYIYIVRDVILPCPRVCAEQFGVIWAQYQRGLCPLTLSLKLSLSHSLKVSARIQREPGHETERINHKHLDFSRRPRNAFLTRSYIYIYMYKNLPHACPDGLRNHHIYVRVIIYT
jgi:hypothetical protein